MRAAGHAGDRLMRSNYSDAYRTVAQLVAHHTVNGCNLRDGDLFGSGTLSGPAPDQGGSLLELSHGGKQPIHLSNGETRTWLEDGDSVILRGCCQREGFRRIGFWGVPRHDFAGACPEQRPHALEERTMIQGKVAVITGSEALSHFQSAHASLSLTATSKETP